MKINISGIIIISQYYNFYENTIWFEISNAENSWLLLVPCS